MDELWFDDPDKEKARRRFMRRGGTKRRHGRRPCHADSNSGCNHDTALGFDNMTPQDHDAYIERQASRQDATEW